MIVARSTSPREVAIEQLPDPVPGPADVVCRVLACGVCKSDVLDWYVEPKLPAVLGHELAAEVEAVGAEVAGVAVGDRVCVNHHSPCGECRRCRRGHETLCERFRASGLDPGGFAERVRVPGALVGELLAIGDLDPVAATFVEPLACVLRAQERAGLAPRRLAAGGGRRRQRPAADRRRARAGGGGGVGARAPSRAPGAGRALGGRAPRQRAGGRGDRVHSGRRRRSPRPRPAWPPAARCACTRRRRRAPGWGSTATPCSGAS